MRSIPLFLLAAAIAAPVAFAQTQEPPQPARLIVRYKDATTMPNQRVMDFEGKRAVMSTVRSLATGGVVLHLDAGLSAREVSGIVATLKEDPSVASVDRDVWVRTMAVNRPLDPYFASQWGIQSAGMGAPSVGSAKHSGVWDQTVGTGAVVAVIDSGILPHPQLQGKVIGGYDFISDASVAGDGDGRDADPTDTGDYCVSNGVLISNSSWHGTRVAGLIAASIDGQSVVGAAPGVSLLNVRALGRCGGWMSDVADAIVWAAGGAVPGAPLNPAPAAVLNLSLGSDPGEACPSFMQDAINTATSRGALVVAAAGNETSAALGSPSSCQGVIPVASHTRNGDLAAYSNYSPAVVVSGPGGGNCRLTSIGCQRDGALTINVTGSTSFTGYGDSTSFTGTSAAAPFVTAALALVKSVAPSTDTSRATSWLRASSTAFAAGTYCAENQGACGSFGMLNVEALLSKANNAYSLTVAVAASATKAIPGTLVTLTATPSVGAGTPSSVTYTWTQKSGPAISLTANRNMASFVIPAKASGSVVIAVQASDGAGQSTQAETTVLIDSNTAPTIKMGNVTQSSGNAGVSWSLTPSVSDAENNYSQLVLVSGPAGLRVGDDGKSLYWSNPVAGRYTLVFRAMDSESALSSPVSLPLNIDVGKNSNDGGAAGSGWLGALMLGGLALLRRRSLKA